MGNSSRYVIAILFGCVACFFPKYCLYLGIPLFSITNYAANYFILSRKKKYEVIKHEIIKEEMIKNSNFYLNASLVKYELENQYQLFINNKKFFNLTIEKIPLIIESPKISSIFFSKVMLIRIIIDDIQDILNNYQNCFRKYIAQNKILGKDSRYQIFDVIYYGLICIENYQCLDDNLEKKKELDKNIRNFSREAIYSLFNLFQSIKTDIQFQIENENFFTFRVIEIILDDREKTFQNLGNLYEMDNNDRKQEILKKLSEVGTNSSVSTFLKIQRIFQLVRQFKNNYKKIDIFF